MSTALVDRAATALERLLSRRSFINRAALVGTAVAVGEGVDLVLRPGTAYARVCGCSGQDCACGSKCCNGYTAFCCTINGGANYCPPNTVMGGWWKADRSSFCGGGPRYYMDCNAICMCGSGALCGPDCDTTDCGCANGSCNEWRTGCVHFRYGQCNQDVAPIGRIVCRMVACIPPWEIDPTCTTVTARDNSTAEHSAPCWEDVPPCPSSETRCQAVGIASTSTGGGYAVVTEFGRVLTFGDAVHVGDDTDRPGARYVSIASSPLPLPGYWIATKTGEVRGYGSAQFFGDLGGSRLKKPIVGIAATPSGGGYWLVASDGGIFCFGDARFFGSLGAIRLNQPIVGMAATRSGGGYWLVASDGGVFCFGDATFFGSLGSIRLNQPIVGIVTTPDGGGYLLIAADGGVFTFGSAQFRGSAADAHLRRPVSAVVPDTDGEGSWMVVRDGTVLAYGAADHGSANGGTP